MTRLSATPARNRGPNALLGAHTRQILRELGYTDADVDELVASGVCVESGHRRDGRDSCRTAFGPGSVSLGLHPDTALRPPEQVQLLLNRPARRRPPGSTA